MSWRTLRFLGKVNFSLQNVIEKSVCDFNNFLLGASETKQQWWSAHIRSENISALPRDFQAVDFRETRLVHLVDKAVWMGGVQQVKQGEHQNYMKPLVIRSEEWCHRHMKTAHEFKQSVHTEHSDTVFVISRLISYSIENYFVLILGVQEI